MVPTIWKPDHSKSDVEKVRISFVSGFLIVWLQIPTVFYHFFHIRCTWTARSIFFEQNWKTTSTCYVRKKATRNWKDSTLSQSPKKSRTSSESDSYRTATRYRIKYDLSCVFVNHNRQTTRYRLATHCLPLNRSEWFMLLPNWFKLWPNKKCVPDANNLSILSNFGNLPDQCSGVKFI